MREVWALVLVGSFGLFTAGCVEAFGDRSPYEPGESLGTFHLTAKQKSNGCGDGALGAPAVWEFDVRLRWEEETLFWDSGGQIITGTLSADHTSFEIASDVVQDMRTAADQGKPACSIARHDAAKGKLTLEGDGVSKASGTLSYAFEPTSGSSCADLVGGEAPTFEALPCSMAFSFEAPRTGD